MKKLSPEKKCLLILIIFNFIALVVFIPISVNFSLWGLSIGWIIGTAVTFINTLLLFKSGHLIVSQAKDNKGTALSVLFYFLRFGLIAAAMVVCALLDYVAKHDFFAYSIFTCAASVLPSTLVITIFYHSDEEEKVDKK